MRNLLDRTLLALQSERLNVDFDKLLEDSLKYLIEMKIIGEKVENDEKLYETTKLGKATVEGKTRRVFSSNFQKKIFLLSFRKYRFEFGQSTLRTFDEKFSRFEFRKSFTFTLYRYAV